MISRHVETVFCDDIREETSGKLSLIGVYTGQLLVRNFPSTLPKLCILIRVVTQASEPVQSLTLRILKDEETFAELPVRQNQLAGTSQASEDEEDDGKLQVTQCLLVFSPFAVEKPCTLRIRAITESEELAGLGLHIKAAPQDSTPNVGSRPAHHIRRQALKLG